MKNTKTNLLTGCHLSWMCYYPVYKPPKGNFDKIIPLRVADDNYGMYIKKRSCSYVAFRGSKSMKELVKAITAFPLDTQYGVVHNGFWERYLNIKEQVHDILSNDTSQDMFFVGHSMGGCLALFTAFDASKYNGQSNLHCYMYGSPVAADKKYINNVTSSIEDVLSVEINNDLVPKLPLNPSFIKPKVLVLNIDVHTHNLLKCHSCSSYFRSIRKNELGDGNASR